MNLTCKVDTTGLAKGITAAAQYSKRTLAQICNTSAYWVAVNAAKQMPFVTADKIDTELGKIVTPKIGKSGKELSGKYAKNLILSGSRMGWKHKKLVKHKDAPLAALIVMASSKGGSHYNETTGHRWYTVNPFRGKSRAAGRAAMRVIVDKMIKRRRKSGHFLYAGWIPAIRKMAQNAVQKFFRGGSRPNASTFYGANLGDARPASEGFECAAVIENDIGLEGKNAESFNKALMLHGTGPLQSACDNEGKRNMEYALSKMGGELKTEFEKHTI